MDSLRYEGMEDREERITEAYDTTFQWVFEDPLATQVKWSDFKTFLRSDTSLYWITGKAGSGKSTLIKYVCHGSMESEPNGHKRSCPLGVRYF